LFLLVENDRILGYKRGIFDSLKQVGGFKSGLLKAVGVGVPRQAKVYYSGKKSDIPTLIIDCSTHLAVNIGEGMIPDVDLVDVLSYVCEDKIWRYMAGKCWR
jgi:hypothetical protein